MNLRLPAVAAGLALGLLTAVPASAVWYVTPAPYAAKDFTLVKRAGVYHLFYTQRDTSRSALRNEYRFGHVFSRDLWSWSEVAPVLDASQGVWEHDHVWSPHVVEADGLYYLFYTGVNVAAAGAASRQSIGVAVSSDLYKWTRHPEPVLECADLPWSFCDPEQPLGGDLRDPFIMPDPASPGGYLLYHVTRLDAERDAMVAGLASSSGLDAWRDQGPLMVTHHSTSFSPLTESPHVFEHDGVYYLAWTTNAGQPLVFATSGDPRGPWTYRGRLTWMIGLDTAAWFASETLRDGATTYFAFVNFDRVDVRRIVWSQSGDTWSLAQPDTLHVFNLYWDAADAVYGQRVNLKLEALGSAGRSVGLELWEVDDDGQWDRLDNAAYGLPASAVFTRPNLAIPWVVPLADDTDEADPDPEFVVRLDDGTAQSGVLRAHAASPDASDPRQRRQMGGDGDLVEFRLLRVTPLGPGPALAVELPRAARVRVELFDLAGRRVATLLDEALPAGPRVVRLDAPRAAGAAARGLYFARLTTPWGARVARIGR